MCAALTPTLPGPNPLFFSLHRHILASGSADKTVKIWTVGTAKSTANYSLVGHEAGVNCVDFSKDLERPHICSGSDDGEVKVWDIRRDNVCSHSTCSKAVTMRVFLQ